MIPGLGGDSDLGRTPAAHGRDISRRRSLLKLTAALSVVFLSFALFTVAALCGALGLLR